MVITIEPMYIEDITGYEIKWKKTKGERLTRGYDDKGQLKWTLEYLDSEVSLTPQIMLTRVTND